MNGKHPTWTMDGFLGWAFGAQTLHRVSDLVSRARGRVAALRASPTDGEVRRELSALLRWIRREADERLWRAEADRAGALVRLLGSRQFEAEQVQRLDSEFHALEAVIGARVEHQENLQRAGAARQPATAAA
jgi:hypothetical protein